MFYALWTCDKPTDVDIYLLEPGESKVTGKPMASFDPQVQQDHFFSDELYFDIKGASKGADVWVSGRNFTERPIRVYYKLAGDTQPAPSCTVRSWIESNYSDNHKLEIIHLDAATPWILAGVLKVLDEGKVEFVSSTPEERKKDKADVMQRLRDK